MQPAHAPHTASGQAGFSLIQVVVILMISTVVLVSFLLGNDAGDNNQKMAADIKKLDKVEDAMIAFMTLNGRRPCPADGARDVNVHEFGLEADNPGDCVSGTIKASLGPDGGTGHIVAGAIPTKTLALPDDYAYDSWGRRFTYTVDSRATDNLSCYYLQKGMNTADIDIQNGSGTTLARSVYAYLSHGPDGHGAFPAQGSSAANRINKGSTDVDQNINAGVDSSFNADFTNIRIKKDRTATFDDLVYYRNETRNACCLGDVCNTLLPVGFRATSTIGLGYRVTHGDINGDGLEDIIISAPIHFSDAGAVYVLFGTRAGFNSPVDLSTLNGTNGFHVVGAANNHLLGSSIAAADVNGDGISDLVMGAPGTTYSGAGTGSVYVMYGKVSAFAASYNLGTTPLVGNSTGFRLDGDASDGIGSASSAGDVTGDGIADLVMGTNSTNHRAYVIFGHANPWSDTQTLTTPGYVDGTSVGVRLTGPVVGAASKFGASTVIAAVNNTGFSDLIIGDNAYNGDRGAVYVFFGRAAGAGWGGNQTLTTPDGTSFARIDGENASDFCGGRLSAGDLNGDNNADILIGCDMRSSAYVFFGKNSSWVTGSSPAGVYALSSLVAGRGFRIDGNAGTHDLRGASPGFADIKGAGKQAALLGAFQADSNTGRVFALYGQLPSVWNFTTFDLTTLTGAQGLILNGNAAGDKVGFSVSGWDINGDGLQEVFASSYDLGTIYVYFGNTTPPATFNLNGL